MPRHSSGCKCISRNRIRSRLARLYCISCLAATLVGTLLNMIIMIECELMNFTWFSFDRSDRWNIFPHSNLNRGYWCYKRHLLVFGTSTRIQHRARGTETGDCVRVQLPVPDIISVCNQSATQGQLSFSSLRVGKWVPASVRKAKTSMVYSVSGWTQGVQVKLRGPFRTRAVHERLWSVFTARRYTNPRFNFTLPYMRKQRKHKAVFKGASTSRAATNI